LPSIPSSQAQTQPYWLSEDGRDIPWWKAKYGGMEVSDARRLKALEDENTKLKKLLAEAMLDNAMLRDVAARKW